eukprot:g83024.t1
MSWIYLCVYWISKTQAFVNLRDLERIGWPLSPDCYLYTSVWSSSAVSSSIPGWEHVPVSSPLDVRITKIPDTDPRAPLRGQYGLFAGESGLAPNTVLGYYTALVVPLDGAVRRHSYSLVWAAGPHPLVTVNANGQQVPRRRPNVYAFNRGGDGLTMPVVRLVVSEEVRPGEEILLDYGRYYWQQADPSRTTSTGIHKAPVSGGLTGSDWFPLALQACLRHAMALPAWGLPVPLHACPGGAAAASNSSRQLARLAQLAQPEPARASGQSGSSGQLEWSPTAVVPHLMPCLSLALQQQARSKEAASLQARTDWLVPLTRWRYSSAAAANQAVSLPIRAALM